MSSKVDESGRSPPRTCVTPPHAAAGPRDEPARGGRGRRWVPPPPRPRALTRGAARGRLVGGSWRADISIAGKKHYMGLFDSAAEAGWARDRHARRLPRQLSVRWRNTLFTSSHFSRDSTGDVATLTWCGHARAALAALGEPPPGASFSQCASALTQQCTAPGPLRARSRGCATRNVLRLPIVHLGLSAESLHFI